MVLPPQSVPIKTTSNISDLTKSLTKYDKNAELFSTTPKSKHSIKTDLWTHPNPHIYMSTGKHKVAPKGAPFLYYYKKGWIRPWKMKGQWLVTSEGRVDGKKLRYGCLVCSQMPDNIIRDGIEWLDGPSA